ncbi:TonB-dependent receptor [Lutibacter sp. TH_r2]|uniref:TonB-dependent receptor n=1 Tax=Lutibacter sp. TH_r2 TaxID=3082083 RepID=UPI002953BE34|nr:TonB-dependent receptor [Lutibacter sp. TH_r2]MDV7187384.1 TonB-dependent receptor [Lutibacter sp. TH_r2]
MFAKYIKFEILSKVLNLSVFNSCSIVYKKLVFIAILFLVTLNLFSQSISGIVLDEEKKPLEFASVSLLNPVDSMLVKYTTTGIKGEFEIKNFKEGAYLIQIYMMTYQVDQRKIDLSKTPKNLGNVILKREVNQLDEVVVKAIIPVKIKQDTMAYNTKAFKVRQDDNVGDLVKKLPGVEVEANGEVSAQGQVVMKILVDGKEFFNNDPTIALQNLSADAIESIEIIDEDSEDTKVTGVKDGEKYKVLNLVLKEGKKVGYFGKAGVGVGTNNRYTTNLDINAFTSDIQLAVFGKLNNINNTGASVFERDGSKTSSSSGELTTGTSGANFNYEIKKDLDFNVDYYYGYSENLQEVNSNRTEFINNDETLNSKIDYNSDNVSNNHNINFSLRDRSKKNSYLALRGNFKSDNRVSDGTSKTIYLDANENEDILNDRITHSEDSRKDGKLDFSYRKKMNKNGRSIKVVSGFSFTDYFDENFQQNFTKYQLQDPDSDNEKDVITTQDDIKKGVKYNLSFRYSEPIIEHHHLSFTSSIRNEIRDIELIQNKTVNTIENPYNYVQDYYRDNYSNQLSYNFSINKFQFSLSGILDVKEHKLEVDDEVLVKKEYNNLLPRASFSYQPRKGSNFRVIYNKNIGLPGYNQMSPVINDFNPLRISFGNPDLTPSETENIQLKYYKYNFKNANNFYAFVRYSNVKNAIIPKRYFDEDNIRYSTYENYGSRFNFKSIIHFSKKISRLGLRYVVKINTNLYDRITNVDDNYNKIDYTKAGFGLSFNNTNKNILDIIIGTNFDYTNSKYSIDNSENNNYNQNYYTKVDWDFLNSLNVNSQFNYTIISDTNFDTQTLPIWNVALEYAFLKGQRGNLKLQVFDLLNKDVGVHIKSTADYYEESFRKSLGTYTMVSFTYSLKPPKGKRSYREKKKKRT